LTIWNPDTCDCRIEFNKRVNWIKTHNKCRLHKSLNGQNLLNEVLAQNRRFNTSIIIPDITDGIEPSPIIRENLNRVKTARTVNKLRIRTENLDNFDEHLPIEQTLTFFQNLKRILRGLTP